MSEVSRGSHQLKRRRCGLVLTCVIGFEGLYWFCSFPSVRSRCSDGPVPMVPVFLWFHSNRSDSFVGFLLVSLVSARAYFIRSAGCRRNYD